ncbi:alpha/beta hydrolase [Phenylobacterium sp. VNQ135]|uniref:alpha/beta hydrolase n=1 Tax=Phenylobacterium sp. VNQ135 TaxID=3400922 RepID=UPI003C07300D
MDHGSRAGSPCRLARARRGRRPLSSSSTATPTSSRTSSSTLTSTPARGAILLVKYRGYRRSSGKPSETALAQDADAFFDWLAAQPQVDRARIATHGHSLGAAVAAGLANRRPVRALVMVSAFKSPDLFGRYLIPPILARSRFDNMAAVKRYPGPIPLVHGEGNEIIPHTHVQALARQAAGDVTLISYPGVDHDVPWDWRRFAADLTQFYRQAGVIAPVGVPPSSKD